MKYSLLLTVYIGKTRENIFDNNTCHSAEKVPD